MGAEKLDVIFWAHSDQAGGTEMACVICSALRRRAGLGLRCGIVTPYPEGVKDFFKLEPARSRGIVTIPFRRMLVLGKDAGSVSPDVTYDEVVTLAGKLLAELDGQKVPAKPLKPQQAPENEEAVYEQEWRDYKSKLAVWHDDVVRLLNDKESILVEKLVRKGTEVLEKRCHEGTLIVSCGEPLALIVAEDLWLKKVLRQKPIIVTDHLITDSVRHALGNIGGGGGPPVGAFLNALREKPQCAQAAFLSPPEFGVPEYIKYLSEDCGLKCMEIGGLMYDPIHPAELINAPHYRELAELRKENPVVIVFGGGGTVWDEIYAKLDEAARKELADGALPFALILRNVQNGKAVSRTWQLFSPTEKEPRPLHDPGRMMYWYAACTLLVGRGGLAAQQILATPTSERDPGDPAMLFVDEPGHRQINSEWRLLQHLGLVRSIPLPRFQEDPFGEIKTMIDAKDDRRDMRARVGLRYQPRMMDRLADFILEQYKPNQRSLATHELLDVERTYSYFRGFLYEHEDELSLPGFLGGDLWPHQLEIHPPSSDPERVCWLSCPTCFGANLDKPKEELSEDAALSVIRELKGKVSRIVVSGLFTDPLFSNMTPKLLKAARDGVLQNIGLHTKLLDFPEDVADALFKGCWAGDYLTVSLDAGEAATFGEMTGETDSKRAEDNFTKVLQNLESVKDRRKSASGRLMRFNVTYLLTPKNCDENNVREAYKIAKQYGADVMRYGVAQPQVTDSSVERPLTAELEQAVDLIREEIATQSGGPVVKVSSFTQWSSEGFKRCYTQLLYPCLGADGHLYPCCQVAHPEFGSLRLGEVTGKPGEKFKDIWQGNDRRQTLDQEVGDRLGQQADKMNCRVCNRMEGALNTGLAAWFMSDA